MPIIVRREWFGGLIGDTYSYKLRIINEFTFNQIYRNKSDTKITNLLDESGFNPNENIIVINNLEKTHIEKKILTAPVVSWIELTGYCPNNCLHCFNNTVPISMPIKNVKRVISDFRKLGVYKVTLTGGEPLKYNKLDETLYEMNNCEIGTRLFTSGNCEAKELEKLIPYKVDVVFVSIDGFKHNDRLRGSGSFRKSIKAIELIKHKLVNVKDIVISLTLHKKNFNELETIYKLANRYAIKTLLVRPLFVYKRFSNGLKKMQLNKKQLNNSIIILEQLSNKYNVEYQLNKIPFALSHKNVFYHDDIRNIAFDSFVNTKRFGCVGGNIVCGIKSSGKVISCGFIDLPYNENQNIYNSSLAEIWRDSYNINILRKLNGNKTCEKCAVYNICHGGCRANSYNNNGDINGVDDYCFLENTDLGKKEYDIANFQDTIYMNTTLLEKEKKTLKKRKLFISKYNLVTKCGWSGGM